MVRNLLNLVYAVDQFLFCLVTLGHAKPDEVASAAAWRLEQEGHWSGKFWRPKIDWVFARLPGRFKEQNHCEQAFWHEVKHSNLPPIYRKMAEKLYMGVIPWV